MTSAIYLQLTPAKTKSFLRRLNAANPDYGFEENTVKILKQNLSFAPGWVRYDCEDQSEMPHRHYIFVADDEDIKPVVYTSQPIEDLWDTNDLVINENTVFPFLNFYLMTLNTGGETLRPMTSVDDVSWRDDLAPTARKSLDKELMAYPVISKEKDNYIVKTAAVFRHSLMEVTFEVTSEGKITIKDKKVIIEDLPIINDLSSI